MRLMSVLMASAVLASCTTGPSAPAYRSADKQREFQVLLAGKTAQRPMSCLSHFRSGDMRVIDDNTIAFRDGSKRTYVVHMLGGCSNLGTGHYALVTKQLGSADLCRGDIAQVVDTMNGMTVGSCSFGDFVPYVAPGA
jgi:hypothetical protein